MDDKREDKELGHYLKILVKSSFFIFVATIISKLFSYGYKIIIARSFGAETYGLFSLALIVLGIAASIAALGLGDGLVRYISFYRGKKAYGHIRRLISSSRTIFIITSVLCTILLIIIAPLLAKYVFHTDKFTSLMIGLAFALPFSLLANLSLGILRGFERVKTYATLVNIYQNSAKFILLGLLLLMGVGVVSVYISYILMFVGLCILSAFYAKKNIDLMPKMNIPESNKVMPEVLSYAWPLLFVGILYSIFYWTDSLILGYFTNPTQVGWYNSAITLVSLFGIAPDLFMQLFFPLISFKLSEGKKELIRKLTKQVTKWIYILSIPLFILLFLFPEQWLWFLFGTEFIVASSTLQILALGALLASSVGLSTSLLSIKGKTRLVLVDFIVFTIVNITLDILLVPLFGMMGAATATLTTQVLFAVTVVSQVKSAYGFNPLRARMRRLIASTVCVLIIGVLLAKITKDTFANALIISLILIILYALCLYLLRVFDSEDKSIVKSIVLKLNIKKSMHHHTLKGVV